jgi:hypothetical protein
MNLQLILTLSVSLASVGANFESRNLLWANDNDIQSDNWLELEFELGLGRLEIYQGENAAKAVEAFVQSISVNVGNLNLIDQSPKHCLRKRKNHMLAG